MKMSFVRTILFLVLINGFVIFATAQMTPQQAILKMTCGINVGRSLELPNEGDAGNRYIQEYYFTDFKAAGFNFVRIPVQWDQHTGTTAPYTVNATWLKRVETVVNWSLKHGIICMINSHHDRWILEDASFTAQEKERFVAIWTQVAEYFKDKSDSLFFEIANEPNGLSLSQINSLNASVISTIRATNPTRIIVYSGNSYTPVSAMKSATRPNDPFIMGTFHSYDPWNFCGLGQGTWGTTSEINSVKSMMNDAASWSSIYKIPVILGEFGTVGKCDAASRMKWFYNYLQEARRKNIAPVVWQDFGDFSVYFNTTNASSKWNTIIKDIIVYTHPLSADAVSVSIVNTKDAQLTWTNRASGYKWIRVERKAGSAISIGTYQSLATLSGDATSYQDATTVVNATYSYRVVSELSTGEVIYSFPVEKKIVAVTSSSSIGENSEEFAAYIAADKLIIQTYGKRQAYLYRIYSLSGQLIRSGHFNSELHDVSVSDLPRSFYLVNLISSEGKSITRKVVKN